MHYENWDVLLFPGGGSVPLKEFRTDCSVIPDFESKPAPCLGSFIGLPAVHGFVPSLHRNMPLTVSVFSWTVPPVSNPNRDANLVVFAARVYIDGDLVAEDVWNQNQRAPLTITQSLKPNKHGDRDVIRFPAFNERYLQENGWNPAASLGRIQVIITEAYQRDPTTLSLDPIKNVAAFSFCHAPLETLEEAAIAWPNRHMWENATLAYSFPSAVYSTNHSLASQQGPARLVIDPSPQPLSSTPAPATLPVFQKTANPPLRVHSTGNHHQHAGGESQGRGICRNPSRTSIFPVVASTVHPSVVHQDTSLPTHGIGPFNPMLWGARYAAGRLYPSDSSTVGQQEQDADSSISLDVPTSATDSSATYVDDAKPQAAPAAKRSISDLVLSMSDERNPLRRHHIPIPAMGVRSRKECRPGHHTLEPLTTTSRRASRRRELSDAGRLISRLDEQNTPEPMFALIDPVNTVKRAPSLGTPSKKQFAAAKSVRRSVSFDPVIKDIESERSQPATKPSQCKRDFTPLDVAEVIAQSDQGHSSPIL
ncbi:hypothetical protein BDP81DRAFT_405590 [Colletotrichum phormii]|uniref:Uncharacterized protein n=1 Tax=Colletotrichum phormii TaxID=359342 RepID=A0AAI9ZTD4_9PEZI|nr:uncharacterized protein BDP81DRAFT_405590 [Colletotrichum phormii]KAK1637506.1 hypothetical protein BDP81DRAFT_405590 [Colletotrichum phormii]